MVHDPAMAANPTFTPLPGTCAPTFYKKDYEIKLVMDTEVEWEAV